MLLNYYFLFFWYKQYYLIINLQEETKNHAESLELYYGVLLKFIINFFMQKSLGELDSGPRTCQG
jgi:hypothetical protein